MRRWRIQYNHNGKQLEERVLGALCGQRISLRVKGKVVPLYKTRGRS